MPKLQRNESDLGKWIKLKKMNKQKKNPSIKYEKYMII